MEEFGFSLRLAREKRGLTQKQVMAMTGINNKTLSGYENGVSEPDIQTLLTLLKLYGMSPSRFFGQETFREELSQQEEQLLSLYRELSEQEREEWLAALQAVLHHRGK